MKIYDYAKIVNNNIVFAENPLNGKRYYINPTHDIFIENGYKPVIKAIMPVKDGYYYTKNYVIDNGEVKEVYEEHKLEVPYAEKVEQYIRERYTVSDELAILRQRDTKPQEFEEYNAFCEECKLRAKV